MKTLSSSRSSGWTFFANCPSALERAVRQSPKSRRLRMEPLENRALLAVDAFGGAALADVGESWGPDPAPVFSASVLATDAAIIDVSGIDATSAAASFSVQTETPTPDAPPSFEQLMESLGMIEIESLGDETDVASLSFLDAATDEIAATSDATVRRVVFEGSGVEDTALHEPTVVVPTVSINDESASNGARSGGGDPIFYNVSCALTSSIASSFDDFSNPLSERVVVDGTVTRDYLAVALPEVPYGYYANVTIGGEAAYGSDFIVFTYNAAMQRFEQNSFYGSDFQHSGGATTFYIAPVDDDVTEPIETVTYTLSEPKPLGSGGGTLSANELAYGSLTATATIVDDDADVVVYWRDGSGANGAELSNNPNGGGSRVYPEEALNADGSKVLHDSVNLNFVLKEEVTNPEGKKIFFKLLDPTNYLRVTTPRINDNVTKFLRNGDNLLYYNEIYEVTIPYGQTAVFTSISFSLPELSGDTLARAGDNFIVVADTNRNAVSNTTTLGVSATDCYQVVRDDHNPNVAQTQLLTVWRTLWAELDQKQVDNQNLAPKPALDLAAAEFERACISIREYPLNNTLGVRDIANGNVPTDWRAYIQAVRVPTSTINFAVVAAQEIVSNTNETTVNTTITVYQGNGLGINEAEMRQRATFAGIQSLFPELNISLDVGNLYQYGNRTLTVVDLLNVQRSQILR